MAWGDEATAYGTPPAACLSLTGVLLTGGHIGFSGGNRPTGGLGSDGTGRGDNGDSYMARIEMAPMAREAA